MSPGEVQKYVFTVQMSADKGEGRRRMTGGEEGCTLWVENAFEQYIPIDSTNSVKWSRITNKSVPHKRMVHVTLRQHVTTILLFSPVDDDDFHFKIRYGVMDS